MSNPFTATKKALREKIGRLEELYLEAENLEREWRPNESEKPPPPKKTAPERDVGRRAALNDGPTWSEAIAGVLSDHRPRTVNEIVKELRHSGRVFGEATRPDALVRSTLHRVKARQGWVKRGKPGKWSLPKEQGGS